MLASSLCQAQGLQLNDLEYFERQGVNVLVFNNSFNGGFNDEKNSGIEIIHHGVRTAQGGAIRLNNAPEQWDLVPTLIDRKVDKASTRTILMECPLAWATGLVAVMWSALAPLSALPISIIQTLSRRMISIVLATIFSDATPITTTHW